MGWFALLGRLATMDRPKKFGILHDNSCKCVFCKQEESINHIFLHC